MNCRSLSEDKVNYIAYEYICDQYHLNFLCLTETWCNHDNVGNVYFPGFKKASHYSRSTHKGGGVRIWCRENVDITPINLHSYCIEKTFEICGIVAHWRF
uniref:Endonuclease/exonuclease/phosphatase domain-containing protein n=1 Tax=Photinus pyralis TaxID=7054 RepID=A0A1Y1JUX8_PHOPY